MMTIQNVKHISMSNGIVRRQNKESNIAKLAAQRQLYNDVDTIDIISFMLTVIIPLILAAIQEVVVNCVWVKMASCIYSIVMFLLSILLKSLGQRNKNTAASIQQEFDIDVYQMPWDRKLFGERKDLTEEIAAHSKRILGDSEKRVALLNWYTTGVDSLPPNEGIAACQRENCNWDIGLRKRFKLLNIVVLCFIIGIPIIVCVVKNLTMQDYIIRLFITVPALKWFTEQIKDLGDDINQMKSLESNVFSKNEKNMEELQFTQKEIYKSRKKMKKIPNWFYEVFKDNDEDRERRAIAMGKMK